MAGHGVGAGGVAPLAAGVAAGPGRRGPSERRDDGRLVEGLRRVQAGGFGQDGQGRCGETHGADRCRAERCTRDAIGDDRATVQEHDPIQPTEHAGIVLHAQDDGAAGGQFVEEGRHVAGPRRIELGGRLIEDEDDGAHRDDAGDGHPLLLAARQREGLAIGEVGDTQAGQDGIDPRVHLRTRHGEVLQSEGELLADRLLGGRELVGGRREDDADPTQEGIGLAFGGVDAIDADAAGQRGPHDARDEAAGGQREGRLAGARPAGDADPLPGPDVQVDGLERGLATAGIADADVRQDEAPGVGGGGGILGHRPNTPVTAATTMPTHSRRRTRRSQASPGGSSTVR